MRGCTSPRTPIHLNPNMDDQQKLQPQEASEFFYDGAGMRPPVEGTVARGELGEDEPFTTGKDAAGEFLNEVPQLTAAQRERGAERYRIYCQPCHDEQRLAYPPGRVFDVITNGSGLMKGYRWPIPPADRWAIVVHVQELQRARQERDLAAANLDRGAP